MNAPYSNQFENQFQPKNNIEQILENSVQLFLNTNMPELAARWDVILQNYRRSQAQRAMNR